MGRDRIIEAYIQRLLSWEQPVTQDTLAVIAQEVGITSDELTAISTQADSHLTRGRAYIEFGCLDDAVKELGHAASLEPLNLDVLHTLANTYNLRYNRTHDADDRQKALLVAKRCVELKPDDKEALVLISFLENNSTKGNPKPSPWTQQKVAALAGGVVTFGIGMMGLSRLPIFSPPPAPMGPAPGTIVPGSVIYESLDAADANDSQSARDDMAIELSSDVDIPVVFDYPGLVMEPRRSELGDYEDATYYQLQGVFINSSNQEFSNLVLDVEFLDRNGVAIATAQKEAIADTDALIRPGDTHTFNLLQKITPELETVRLSAISLQQAPARRTYVPPTPINYSWDQLEPEDISFELASRSEEFSGPTPTSPQPDATATGNPDAKPTQTPAGPTTFNAEWVIINTSSVPIRELKLKTDFYSGNNRLLQSEDVFAINTNDAPLLPGEIRPFRVVKPVVKGYERYRVTVVDVE
ncbi:tetratricopeptide repeat domain protein [Leptolyngbya sp. Heron Island J]|uniref:tetratricopeptide repeat protein n=1 Tax=Leptolyngbya sp. Heron Island J TaxID=1385935 RepID=UPI0003B99C96|nr:tetratricopeptide repeat domain protein [Leptolyngbya sp. Heron Island J]ESA37094.1 tetratricopeptide repeat domain protein [Leptolyngbya sp. Heron Island J]